MLGMVLACGVAPVGVLRLVNRDRLNARAGWDRFCWEIVSDDRLTLGWHFCERTVATEVEHCWRMAISGNA